MGGGLSVVMGGGLSVIMGGGLSVISFIILHLFCWT
jgi:hypothetical protein